jgi:glycosyltransferase EpsD
MKPKILFVATSDIHIHTFHLSYIAWLAEQGYQVDLAVENRGNLQTPNVSQTFHLIFPRSPFSLQNYKTYQELKKIIDTNHYHAVHCHTPIPSALARLAGRNARANGMKMLYTAHGFHFYKGAPFKNWAIYYPMEYILSKWTDVIITINQEDLGFIEGKMMHHHSYQIKGIGVNGNKFKERNSDEKAILKQKLGFSPNEYLLLYVAEFIPRKNHAFLIESLPKLIEKCPNIVMVFAGKGVLLESMKSLAKKLNIERNIRFLGFRNDVQDLAAIADIGISSSKHEGLGLGLAEEMLCGVPIVATKDKGHREMVVHGKNGFLFEQENSSEFVEFISKIYHNPELHQVLAAHAKEKAKEFLIENSLKSMANIYEKHL